MPLTQASVTKFVFGFLEAFCYWLQAINPSYECILEHHANVNIEVVVTVVLVEEVVDMEVAEAGILVVEAVDTAVEPVETE